MPLYITYDNETLQDGLGSQALRILGIFSIAKVFRINYIHSPIINFIEEYSHNLRNKTLETKLLSQVNNFFSFPSISNDCSGNTIIYFREIRILELLMLKIKFLLSRRSVTVKILLPYKITDNFPFVYSFGIKYLKEKNRKTFKQNNAAVVHVRRGYGYLYSDQSILRERHLPYSYYSSAISKISEKFYAELPLDLIVHTDLSKRDIVWKPIQNQAITAVKKYGTSANQDGELVLPGIDLKTKIDLPPNATIEIKYCDDFFEAFLDMCNCKVLIQSKSSFSYLAGLLNEGVVIWPSSHGHARYSRWISSKKLGLRSKDFQPLMEGKP